MRSEYEKLITLMATISGILIPISLASITFIGAHVIEGIAKTLLIISIPLQTLGLIVSLFICVNLLTKRQSEIELKKDLTYCKIFFFAALILIFISHFIVLLASSVPT